jgi:hypothetical protein
MALSMATTVEMKKLKAVIGQPNPKITQYFWSQMV